MQAMEYREMAAKYPGTCRVREAGIDAAEEVA